ncbi:MAG: Asp23/Gls24 family envelope stress response protein [Clostridiales bacterium]|jgi:uncharacterized alkaline shock family protein YloU|nr:Asp23/Gls24 family envelope stress response protein [Clostridiales bacterium]
MHEIFVNGKIGQIRVADEVLAIISGTAAMEVEGVIAGANPGHSGDMSARFARRNFAKGVKITLEEGKVRVDITIMVKYGYKIHEAAAEVQSRIATALETMVGMQTSEINVNVAGLRLERARPAAAKRRVQ